MALSPDRERHSLSEALARAEAQRTALESAGEKAGETAGAAYGAAVNKAIDLYERLEQRVGRAALFSPNETLEDVPTTALPFLLVPFWLAEVVQRRPTTTTTTTTAQPQRQRHDLRLTTIALARAAHVRFLDGIDAYGLVDDRVLLARLRADPAGFAAAPLSTSGADRAAVSSHDAAARRAAKIAAFTAEHELRRRRDALRADPRFAAADDETCRAAYIADVRCAVHEAFQAVDLLNREAALIDAADAASDAEPLPLFTAADGDGDDARLDAPLRAAGPLLSRAGRPLQPFTLVGSRVERSQAVFRPGHNLPTMSIDEYLAEERRRGTIPEPAAGAAGWRPSCDDDDDDKDCGSGRYADADDDRATYKARAWDDFKDDNPRGSGNTLNKG